MEYVRLGKSGLKVSRICLGCMAFGNQFGWMIEKDKAEPVLKRAFDLGINFFDTANSYSKGGRKRLLDSS